MSYKVQFLDDTEFEALPFRDMHDKVGVAHRESQTAYVRSTGIPTLDLFNAMHELEHIEDGQDGVHADHYDPDYDVYYKKFKDVMKTALPIVASFLLPALAPALGGAFGAIGSGFSGALSGISPALGGAARSIGGAIGSVGSAAGKVMGVGGSGGASAQAAADKTLLQSSLGPTGLGRLRTATPAVGGGMKFGTMAPTVLKTGAGIGGAIGDAAKSMGQSAAQSAVGNMFGGSSVMESFNVDDMDPSLGSFNPSTQSNANVIPGSEGEGLGQGPAGAPGGVSGGVVNKLKAFINQQNESR
jgi:hypothetical protein